MIEMINESGADNEFYSSSTIGNHLTPLVEGELTVGDEQVEVWVPPTPVGGRMRNRSASESFVFTHVMEDKLERPIGWMAVCFITYFNVSGGPWGSEEIVSSVGPAYGFVGLLLFSFLWALPLILITAELSSTFPDDGGYSIWVAEAFGPFWGFQEAYWSWVSGVIDTAIYPVLTYDTAIQIINGNWGNPLDDDDDPTGICSNISLGINPNGLVSVDKDSDVGPTWLQQYLIKLALAVIFALPNLFFVRSFGKGLTFLACFVLLPFLIQTICVGIFNEKDWSNILDVKEEPKWADWTQLISVLYWNLSGFDAISTCAGEVRNPSKSYPRGLLLALLLILCTYIFPLATFVAANKPDWICWDEGWYSVIAQKEVGQWMALWIVISSIAGNSGMYTAEIFEDSWQLCGMAKTGLVPRIFGIQWGEDGSPIVAILFGLFVIGCLIALDFNAIVMITNLYSCIGAMLEVLAFVKLRLVEPNLYRPFRVPIESVTGLSLFIITPLVLGSMIIASSLYTSWISVVLNAFTLVIGFVMYYYMHKQGMISYAYNSG